MNPDQYANTPEEAPKIGFFDITILVLSLYVMGVMLVQTLFLLPPELNTLLNQIDFLVCVVFIADFCVRFRRAPSKLAFLKWGWIDLVSSIPVFDFLMVGRLFRVIRIFRILRAFRSTKSLINFLYRNRAKSLIGTAVLSTLVLVIFSCIAILTFENDKSSNIKTSFDAIWWAISTITTVGYGDKVPVTIEGRIVAIVLMVTGVGCFGVLTGLFARLLVDPDSKKEETDIRKLTEEIRLLREVIEQKHRGT